MTDFLTWFEQEQKGLEGNWSDLFLKEGRYPKMADASGHVVTLPGAPRISVNDIAAILECQTRKDYRFSMSDLHGKNGMPTELDFAARVTDLRFRCNLFHYFGGNKALVMRKLNEHIPDFPSLGLPTETVLPLFGRSAGLILFAGATGSGKSTSQASGLIAQVKRAIHILTIEDPVEYLLPEDQAAEVTQREIGVDSRDFSTAIRAALREKPNIIMVGELRDAETIEAATIAANSGHLVLATTHAATASEAVRRILESVPAESRAGLQNILADALIAVIAQKLLPRADKPGKVLAYEVLTATSAVRANIATGRYDQLPNEISQGGVDGMNLMEQRIKELLRESIITEETAFAYAPSLKRLQDMLGY